MNKQIQDRLLELLADQVLFGLSEEEQSELKKLKKQFPEWEMDVSMESAAAAVNLIDLRVGEPMPAALRKKVSAGADEFFNSRKSVEETSGFAAKEKKTNAPAVNEGIRGFVKAEPKRPFWQWLGWAVAATACVALAFNLWQTRLQTTPEIARRPEVILTPPPELTAAQKLEQLLAAQGDVVQTAFANPADEKQILGDLVWSNAQQKGFVRFRGLPVNDISQETYQVWIFDETRSDKYPVDGGIFNINQDGEVIVPLDPRLKIGKPAMIAITKEQPGGVVVSDRKNIVAIAKI